MAQPNGSHIAYSPDDFQTPAEHDVTLTKTVIIGYVVPLGVLCLALYNMIMCVFHISLQRCLTLSAKYLQ